MADRTDCYSVPSPSVHDDECDHCGSLWPSLHEDRNYSSQPPDGYRQLFDETYPISYMEHYATASRNLRLAEQAVRDSPPIDLQGSAAAPVYCGPVSESFETGTTPRVDSQEEDYLDEACPGYTTKEGTEEVGTNDAAGNEDEEYDDEGPEMLGDVLEQNFRLENRLDLAKEIANSQEHVRLLQLHQQGRAITSRDNCIEAQKTLLALQHNMIWYCHTYHAGKPPSPTEHPTPSLQIPFPFPSEDWVGSELLNLNGSNNITPKQEYNANKMSPHIEWNEFDLDVD